MSSEATINPDTGETVEFKAEIRQLLDILVHSLYTEREIFLRELISNASDALSRVQFEMLTSRDVLDPEAELCIRIEADEQNRLLKITDTGIGMTRAELVENLGTIAHSGAREFIKIAQESQQPEVLDVIGRFGVGFYSVFMVAEWVRVTSRTYQPDGEAASWFATGADSYTINEAERTARGTTIEIKLREDAAEFAKEFRLREVIRRHSDFVPYPIYLGDSQEKVNQQQALWRQQPQQVEDQQYQEFYKQLTLEMEPPLAHIHLVADAPVQIYALLFVPSGAQRGVFSLRREDGLKLYSHNVLIQEYARDLLPEYLRFVQGVVDSEDIPLNVSRESVQSNPVMARIKKVLTGKVISILKEMALKERARYENFWQEFGIFIKEGIASTYDENERATLHPLLYFRTTRFPEQWSSLAEYVGRMKAGQKAIYYILGEDSHSVAYSPHLDYFRQQAYEVITLTEPIDSFMLLGLAEYEGFPLKNVASSDLELPEEGQEPENETPETVDEAQVQDLVERFEQVLGERVSDVRTTNRLSGSVARLVDPEGTMGQEMQRVYRLMGREYEVPKKVLEINAQHPLLVGLLQRDAADPLSHAIIEQVYESALLVEGLHPEPASMITRIQEIMEAAVKRG
ncbi:MAG: molecular chaperone HtpG [Anaerolineales bacterium]|jgi:molecular chaperone HtpG